MKNLNKEKIMDQAAYELSDEIWPIKNKLEKAKLLIGEVMENYFLRSDRDNNEDACWINFSFSKYATLNDIVFDYIFAAFKEIEALEKRATKGEIPTKSTLEGGKQ